MGVTCQILIKKTRRGVYRSGDAVAGIVKYEVDEPTEYQHVTLSLLGKGKCEWSESNGNNSSTTYYGKEKYIVHHVNLLNKRTGETATLNGAYEHPFEFYLPEDIPTSFKDRNGSIIYLVELKFEKPTFFSFNKVFTAVIPVYGSVSPAVDGPVVFGLEKTVFNWFSSDRSLVNLKAEIAKTCLSPGENAELSYVLINDTNVTIPSVRTELYCHIKYTADCGRTKEDNTKVKHCEVESEEIPPKEIKKLSFIIPTLPELYSVQHSKIIHKEYRIRVTVRLPMPHINGQVEMPIVIGERRGGVEPGVEALEDVDDEPPSYWEAVCEEKEKTKKKD